MEAVGGGAVEMMVEAEEGLVAVTAAVTGIHSPVIK